MVFDPSSCTACGSLGERAVADLEQGESLPEAASRLRSLGDGRARRCDDCGAWFRYDYDYEYSPIGSGWETATLERISMADALATLVECAPTDELAEQLRELGAPDAFLEIQQRLHAALDGPEHYAALRKLLDANERRADWGAVAGFVRHSNPAVRKDVLSLLQNGRASSWFRAARASTDPAPVERERALQAAVGHEAKLSAASDELGRALVELLRDPVEHVRQRAITAFARTHFAPPFDRRDEAVAVLREILAGKPSADLRRLATWALQVEARTPRRVS